MKTSDLKKSGVIVLAAFLANGMFSSCKKPAMTPLGSVVVVSTLAGGGVGSAGTTNSPIYGEIGSANGIGKAASFNAPAGAAIDAAGNIYISEAGNYDIRKITPDGVVSTFAGSLTSGFTNGAGAAASFSPMQGIGY